MNQILGTRRLISCLKKSKIEYWSTHPNNECTQSNPVLVCLMLKIWLKQGAMIHTCNPSYLGGGDQEDCKSMPAQANSL
jgi:hypothetical protein